MTTISEFMKATSARVSYGWRWLVWDATLMSWVVYEKRPYSRAVRTIIETTDEEKSLDVLSEDGVR